jgi:hypothetical protein
MSLIIKSLKDARLYAHTTDVSLDYQPDGRSALVKNIRLVNRNESDPAKVRIECKTATAARDTSNPSVLRKVAPLNLEIPVNGIHILDDEITLGGGDLLKITLIHESLLDVVISGIEREL